MKFGERDVCPCGSPRGCCDKVCACCAEDSPELDNAGQPGATEEQVYQVHRTRGPLPSFDRGTETKTRKVIPWPIAAYKALCPVPPSCVCVRVCVCVCVCPRERGGGRVRARMHACAGLLTR
jgi:hypothetical protein